jgi:hypothetical protein
MSTNLHVREDKQPTRNSRQKLLEIGQGTLFGVHKSDAAVVSMNWLSMKIGIVVVHLSYITTPNTNKYRHCRLLPSAIASNLIEQFFWGAAAASSQRL